MQQDVRILGAPIDRAPLDAAVATLNSSIAPGAAPRLVMIAPGFGRDAEETWVFRGILNFISRRVGDAAPKLPPNGPRGQQELRRPRRRGSVHSLSMPTRITVDAAPGWPRRRATGSGFTPPMEVPQVSALTSVLPGYSFDTPL